MRLLAALAVVACAVPVASQTRPVSPVTDALLADPPPAGRT